MESNELRVTTYRRERLSRSLAVFVCGHPASCYWAVEDIATCGERLGGSFLY